MLERAREAGFVRILVPGWDVASSAAALELAARHPDLLVAAVGIHPHHAADVTEAAWAELEALAADTRVRAIGEIGLDHYRLLSPVAVQRAALDRQLALAARTGKPVLVHDRDAHAEVEEALAGWPGPSGRAVPGVLHCFSGDARMADRLSRAGFLVSFALPVAFRSAVGPREAAATLPLTSILIETDAPLLAPGPGRRNEPTTALRVAAEIGRLRGIEPAEVARAAAQSLGRLVGEAG